LSYLLSDLGQRREDSRSEEGELVGAGGPARSGTAALRMKL
jgi:hypothetical protein